MLALLDGDIIAFRCAASCEPTKEKPFREPVEHAIGRADELTYRICNTVSSDEHRIFIGGSENFRKQWYPDYKAHRRSQPKPEYLDAVRNFLVEEWEAELCAGYEADDGIGIAATLIVDSATHAPLFLITEAQFFVLLLSAIFCKKSSQEIH